MKNKGFTLIELMAVVMIVALVAILTIPNIVNQIKKSKESTKDNINDIVISAAKKYVADNKDTYGEDDYCIPISDLVDNDYLKEDIVSSEDNNTSNKVIELKYDGKYSYKVVDQNACKISAVKYLLQKTNGKEITNYTDGDTHEMYTFEHATTEQTPALTDYRYIGNNPYNYLEFNNELWRIVGIFSVENENGKTEQKIKIVRDQVISSYIAWDQNSTNDWTLSTLNSYLNIDYYNELSLEAKQYIDSGTYYLGGKRYSGGFGSGVDIYNWERGTTLFNNTKPLKATSKIALIYPSDYVYTFALGVEDSCFNNNFSCVDSGSDVAKKSWIYNSSFSQWLLSPSSAKTDYVFSLGTTGRFDAKVVTANNKLKPALYLISSVKIDSGDGTSSNPYQFSL